MTQSTTRRTQNNTDFKTVINAVTIGAIIITVAVILAPIFYTIRGGL